MSLCIYPNIIEVPINFSCYWFAGNVLFQWILCILINFQTFCLAGVYVKKFDCRGSYQRKKNSNKCSFTCAIYSSMFHGKCFTNTKHQNSFNVFDFLIDMKEPHETRNILFWQKTHRIVLHFSHEIFSMRFLPFFRISIFAIQDKSVKKGFRIKLIFTAYLEKRAILSKTDRNQWKKLKIVNIRESIDCWCPMFECSKCENGTRNLVTFITRSVC